VLSEDYAFISERLRPLAQESHAPDDLSVCEKRRQAWLLFEALDMFFVKASISVLLDVHRLIRKGI
jgi:hypothetical protein